MSKITPLFQVQGVGYDVGTREILTDISLEIFRGEYVGIIGPNGGGKTTLLKLLLRLLPPTRGTIVRAIPPEKIGYVPQRFPEGVMFPATVEEIVMTGVVRAGSRPERERRVHMAMTAVGIGHMYNERFETLSGGERQRVFLARALALEPDVLCLDEPLSAIDPKSQEDFYHLLRDLHARGLTIIMVTHDIDAIQHEVGRVLCLNHHLECHGAPGDALHSHHTEHYGHHA